MVRVLGVIRIRDFRQPFGDEDADLAHVEFKRQQASILGNQLAAFGRVADQHQRTDARRINPAAVFIGLEPKLLVTQGNPHPFFVAAAQR